jgi:hypothetical protein
MNNVQETSLELMRNYLNNVSDDEFLADYLEAEDFGGITVGEFLNNSSTIASISIFGATFVLKNSTDVRTDNTILRGMQSIKVAHCPETSITNKFTQPANDSIFSYSLAA